ncbi:hypothetical protein [Streptomyces sp. NPDC005091]
MASTRLHRPDATGLARAADQAISAKYTLRHLRRELREEGAIPPDLPPALGDVDPPEPETNPTPEERL